MNEPGKKNPSDNTSLQKRVDEFVEARLTDERLENIWDSLQGASNRSDSEKATYKWQDFAAEFRLASRLKQAMPKLAFAGVFVIGIGVWLNYRASELTIETPASWRNVTTARLPETLRFRPNGAKASLKGTPFNLAGTLAGVSRAGGELTVIDTTFSGRASDGTTVTFRGSLVLSNVPGVTDVKRRKDFTGALLSGELTVGTNAPVHVEQPYSER